MGVAIRTRRVDSQLREAGGPAVELQATPLIPRFSNSPRSAGFLTSTGAPSSARTAIPPTMPTSTLAMSIPCSLAPTWTS
jgi:hypothetical protein